MYYVGLILKWVLVTALFVLAVFLIRFFYLAYINHADVNYFVNLMWGR